MHRHLIRSRLLLQCLIQRFELIAYLERIFRFNALDRYYTVNFILGNYKAVFQDPAHELALLPECRAVAYWPFGSSFQFNDCIIPSWEV